VNTVSFVKLNRPRLRAGVREKASTKFREFFATIQENVNGFKGYTIIENVEDSNDTLVLTFWGSKEDMDNCYSNCIAIRVIIIVLEWHFQTN